MVSGRIKSKKNATERLSVLWIDIQEYAIGMFLLHFDYINSNPQYVFLAASMVS